MSAGLALWLAALGLAALYTRPSCRGRKALRLAARAAAFGAVFLHPTVSSSALSLVSCQAVQLSRRAVRALEGSLSDTAPTAADSAVAPVALLTSNPYIECFRREHIAAGALACVAIALYVTGLPACALLVLRRDAWLAATLAAKKGDTPPRPPFWQRLCWWRQRGGAAAPPIARTTPRSTPRATPRTAAAADPLLEPSPLLFPFLGGSDYVPTSWFFRHIDMSVVLGLATLGALLPLPATLLQLAAKLLLTLGFLAVLIACLSLMRNPYKEPWKWYLRIALVTLSASCVIVNGASRALDLGYGGPALQAIIGPVSFINVTVLGVAIAVALAGFLFDPRDMEGRQQGPCSRCCSHCRCGSRRAACMGVTWGMAAAAAAVCAACLRLACRCSCCSSRGRYSPGAAPPSSADGDARGDIAVEVRVSCDDDADARVAPGSTDTASQVRSENGLQVPAAADTQGAIVAPDTEVEVAEAMTATPGAAEAAEGGAGDAERRGAAALGSDADAAGPASVDVAASVTATASAVDASLDDAPTAPADAVGVHETPRGVDGSLNDGGAEEDTGVTVTEASNDTGPSGGEPRDDDADGRGEGAPPSPPPLESEEDEDSPTRRPPAMPLPGAFTSPRVAGQSEEEEEEEEEAAMGPPLLRGTLPAPRISRAGLRSAAAVGGTASSGPDHALWGGADARMRGLPPPPASAPLGRRRASQPTLLMPGGMLVRRTPGARAAPAWGSALAGSDTAEPSGDDLPDDHDGGDGAAPTQRLFPARRASDGGGVAPAAASPPGLLRRGALPRRGSAPGYVPAPESDAAQSAPQRRLGSAGVGDRAAIGSAGAAVGVRSTLGSPGGFAARTSTAGMGRRPSGGGTLGTRRLSGIDVTRQAAWARKLWI